MSNVFEGEPNALEIQQYCAQIRPDNVIQQVRSNAEFAKGYWVANQRGSKLPVTCNIGQFTATWNNIDNGIPDQPDWEYALTHNGKFKEQLDLPLHIN